MIKTTPESPPKRSRALRDKALRFVKILPGISAQAMLVSIFAADLPNISAHFGGGAQGDFIASVATTSVVLGLLLGGWFGGWLLERMGFRAFFALALIAVGVFGSSAALISDAPLLIGSRILAGVAASFLTTACFALIPLLYEEKDRAGVIGFQTAFGGAVAALCYLAAGFLIDVAGWRAPLFLYLPASLLALVLVPFMPKQSGVARDVPATESKSEWSAVLSHWRFFLLAAALPILVFIGSVQLPLLLSRLTAMTSILPSVLQSLCALFLTVGAYLYGPLCKHLGAVRLLYTALIVVALALSVLSASNGFVIAALGAALLGFGLGPIVPYLNDAAIQRSENDGALVIGVYVTVASLGAFVNPLIFTLLIEAVGIRGALLIVAAGLACTVVYSFFTAGARKAQPA